MFCCVCRVLCHLAPVHRCARAVCCVAAAVSWATWLLFTGVPAWFVALRLRCPGPLGSCSPVCPLGPLCCASGVLGYLAPVHWCPRPVCCVACAVSSATWLLFTGVRAPPVAFLVPCPGLLGSCSPVCPPRVFCCVCGVLGDLAPVHGCARSVCCVASTVPWATWLLFTDVLDRCIVLDVRCGRPHASCSPACTLRVSSHVCGVLGHLAPVHRCARSVCCHVCCVCRCCVLRVRCCVCGGSLWGAHSSIPTAAVCSRQGLGTLRAHTRPSGQRLFRSRQGLANLQARTRPSGQRRFVAGRGWVPSGRALVHPDSGFSVAGRGWVCCRARTRPSGQQLVLLGTCSHAVVRCVLCALSGFAAPGGRCCLAPVRVPWLWLAACLSGIPRGPVLVRGASSSPVTLGAPVGFPDAVVPFAGPGVWAPGFTGRLRGARGGRPRTGLIVPAAGPRRGGALGWLRVVPVWGPAMGLSLAGASGVGLGLHALRWLACVDPVTDTSSFSYRPSFDWGLGRCTGSVLCGRRNLPLQVGGRHAGVPCVCACARPSWPGRAGRPPGRVLVRLTFPLAALSFCFARPPPGRGCPFVVLLFASFLSPFFLSLFPLRAPVVSCVLCFPAPGAFGLGSVCSLPPPPFPFFSPVLRPRCLLFCLVSSPGCPQPWRCLLLPSFSAFHPTPLLYFLPRPFVPAPPSCLFGWSSLLGSACALAASVFPA